MNLLVYLTILSVSLHRGEGSPSPHWFQEPVAASGIYRTAADYQNDNLSLSVDCRSSRHKIKLHNFLNKPYVDVLHEGKKYRFQKAELFGFRTCDGKRYRFYQNEEYQILETKTLTIYQHVVSEPGLSGKGIQTVRRYFFSVGDTSVILPLTKRNLKEALPEQHAFHDVLDSQFSTDDISAYDDFHKMFRVNHLLQQRNRSK